MQDTSSNSAGSSELIRTKVRSGHSPRRCYLKYRNSLPSPYIAYSSFVPKATVEFLMRYKKARAIGVKFEPNGSPLDRITDLEGALHTFVIPTVLVTMHGDYKWGPGHRVKSFGSTEDGFQLGRKVIMSALIQQDYEYDDVMMRVAGLGPTKRTGANQLPTPILTKDKQSRLLRKAYDDQIRDYLVYHLTIDHSLPAISTEVKEAALSIASALDFLTRAIENVESELLPRHLRNVFFHHRGNFVSLEVMFMTAVHQIRNEMLLLERLNSTHGYVYTFNPPAIFVQFFGAPQGTQLLSSVHVTALKYVASRLRFENCKVFAWADFNSPNIVPLIRKALEGQSHIQVMRNDDLFSGKAGKGLYAPPGGAKNAMLVVHNNSDAFGQNIETEASGGSLDGVYGEYSSASGSLMRDRKDLCDRLFEVPPI